MPVINETLNGSFTKFFGTVRQKIFDGKLWYPLLCIKFFDTPNFLKHWRDDHDIFRHCETKNFRRKNVIPPSMHKIFRYPKLSETLKGCPRNFSSIKLFETKNFLKNSRIPSRKFSALWDIKISIENRDMPPLIHKFFSIPENFRKTEGFLYKAFRFGPVRQKVPTRPWCPPLLCMKIFDKRIFLKQHQSVLQWNISVQWDKNFDGKSWYSPAPLIQTFSIPGIIATAKDSSTEIFGTETKNFRRKILIPPPPPVSKLFRYRKFSETQHRSVHPPNFSALWDKKFWTKSRA